MQGTQMFDQILQLFLIEVKPLIQQMVDEAFAKRSADSVGSASAQQQTWLSYYDVAAMMGTTYEGVRALVNKGTIAVCMRGGRRFIHVDDLTAYMQGCKILKRPRKKVMVSGKQTRSIAVSSVEQRKSKR